MNSHFDIFYEVVNTATQETEFVTGDRFIAETHYEEGYTVYEKHVTVTRLSQFTETQSITILHWHDEDENFNHEIKGD